MTTKLDIGINLRELLTPTQRMLVHRALYVIVNDCEHLSLDDKTDRNALVTNLIGGLGL